MANPEHLKILKRGIVLVGYVEVDLITIARQYAAKDKWYQLVKECGNPTREF